MKVLLVLMWRLVVVLLAVHEVAKGNTLEAILIVLCNMYVVMPINKD